METPPPEPAPQDFDQLSKKAYASSSTIEDKNVLWRATFSLKEWQFIARGELPDVHPYVSSQEAVAQGKYMLKAFTDADKLYAFAKEADLLDDKGMVTILTMPVPGFMESLESYEKMNVYGIHFNADAGSTGFYAPLPQLAQILAYLKPTKVG